MLRIHASKLTAEIGDVVNRVVGKTDTNESLTRPLTPWFNPVKGSGAKLARFGLWRERLLP
jgi:hypothetical protein